MKRKRFAQLRPSDIFILLAIVFLIGGGMVGFAGISKAQHKSWTIVLTTDVDGYTQLTKDQVTCVQKPTESLNPNNIVLNSPIDIKNVFDKTVLANEVTVRPLRKDEVLQLNDLTKLTDALPALLVKCGHGNDISVAIPVNPNNGLSLAKVQNGDTLVLSMEDAQTKAKDGLKMIDLIDEHALVMAKDGTGDSGFVYVPVTKEEYTKIQQNGGTVHVMVGLTGDSAKDLGAAQ